jgi:broad specificity phosphatase PhoE
MRVILIRHAESHGKLSLSTLSNIESIPAQTQEDENLTEFGQASAAELGLFLKNNNIKINQCKILALFI